MSRYKIMIVFICAIYIALGSTMAYGRSIIITENEFGEKWPFTVSKGKLSCSGLSVVTFQTAKKTYAVNGTAKSHGYKEINEIWKDDKKMLKILKESFPNEEIRSVPKISIGPIINKGLSLCK